MNRTTKIGIVAATAILLVAALFLFFFFDPGKYPFFPQCPFLLTTGFECPGCGSQRAIHHLLHLNILTALKQNAFMVLALPYIFLGIYLEYLGGKKRHPRLEKIFFGKWSAIVVLSGIVVFWIGRNINII
ncbi:MAG: DUF2752 domain-containing protein [Proteiniphilum sp.]|nr:DUF2752 domain-containing protein [Proteiniphilum sp.]